MFGKKIILVFVMSLISTGCSAMSCDQFVASEIKQYESGIGFFIYKRDSDYWGDFSVHAADHSVSHTNNSMQKFRVSIDDLEFVRFEPTGNAAGRLAIKWKNRDDSLCIATLPKDYWNKIIEFVNDWPESKKFIVSNE